VIDGIGAYNLGSAERPLALLAAAQGDAEAAAAHFDAALAQHRQLGARLLVAGTLRDAGRVLHDDARLAEARSTYAALGLEVDVGLAKRPVGPPPAPSGTNVFRRDGELWLVGLQGSTTRVRDSKGMRDLARLLARPGEEIHVLDLVADGPTLREDAPGDPIDAAARRQYQARLLELEAELTEADDRADVARSEQLHEERDALVAELSGAYGLGGRARRRGDSSERARSTVTQRVRDAIARVEASDGPLGAHLRRSVRTGTFCSYVPEHPTTWDLTP
jgi:hypothetical protein